MWLHWKRKAAMINGSHLNVWMASCNIASLKHFQTFEKHLKFAKYTSSSYH